MTGFVARQLYGIFMGKVDDRINFIIHILATEASSHLSISEIHDKLYERFLESCSRRTVERDLIELMREGRIEKKGRYPAKFMLLLHDEMEVKLTEGDIRYLHCILKEHFKDIRAQRILEKIHTSRNIRKE